MNLFSLKINNLLNQIQINTFHWFWKKTRTAFSTFVRHFIHRVLRSFKIDEKEFK